MDKVDDKKLLGFDQIEPEQDAETSTEDAIGLAFNKRGEAPPPPAPTPPQDK